MTAPLPTPEAIRDAAARLAGVAVRTPLRRSEALSALCGGDVYLKLETEQVTGSFKVRGAFNTLSRLSPEARARGVVASSAGNHGLGVAEAAQRLGIAATIFVPRLAPQVKKDGIRARGATVTDEGRDYDDAMVRARAHADATGATFVHPCLGDDLLAGQGTVALEVLEELPTLGTMLVCVGGAGLLGGMGGWLRAVAPEVRIIGAQTEHTNAMAVALESGQLVEIPNHPSVADGLAGQIDEHALAIGMAALDQLCVVTEGECEHAIRFLHRKEGLRVEGAGAVTVAALLTAKAGGLRFPVACTVSGGNIDADRHAAILAAGVPDLAPPGPRRSVMEMRRHTD